MRLKGKGIPSLRGGPRGNQLVRVFVEVPKHLSREQRTALTEFSTTLDKGKNHPLLSRFLKKAQRFMSGD